MRLIKTGDRVGASEATLLNMLNISPFTYGLQIQMGKSVRCTFKMFPAIIRNYLSACQLISVISMLILTACKEFDIILQSVLGGLGSN